VPYNIECQLSYNARSVSSGIEDLFDNERAHEAIGKLVEELQDAALKVVRVVQAMNRQLVRFCYGTSRPSSLGRTGRYPL